MQKALHYEIMNLLITFCSLKSMRNAKNYCRQIVALPIVSSLDDADVLVIIHFISISF